MQAFIVNLQEHEERRNYVSSILSPFSCVHSTFINAVDGRKLTETQQKKVFATEEFIKEYNRPILPGEIGCTLSHQKIYNIIVEEHIDSALIFEDDIIIKDDIEGVLPQIKKILDSEDPIIILLSGWFWYTKTKNMDNSHKLATVVDGYLTHAYGINYSAAKLMRSDRPYFLADAWEKFKKQGIKIYGLTPHLIDQDWSNFLSTISNNPIRGCKSATLSQWCKIKRRTILQRILKLIGHFEPKEIQQ